MSLDIIDHVIVVREGAHNRRPALAIAVGKYDDKPACRIMGGENCYYCGNEVVLTLDDLHALKNWALDQAIASLDLRSQ